MPRPTGSLPPCHQHWLEGFQWLREWRPCLRALRRALGSATIMAGALGSLIVTNAQGADGDYSTTIYNVYSGLPSNSAQVIRQTRDGYVWIGTELGLSRFDGVRFVNFRVANTPELPSSLIRTLLEDKAGWLWIATQRGLCRYRQGKFERVGFEGCPIEGILQDRRGSIWIATEGQGLWEFRDGQLVAHAGATGMPADPVITMLSIDSHDRLWVGTAGHLVWYDGHSARPYDLGAALFQTVLHVMESAGGDLWFDTNQGLFRLRDGEFQRFGTEQGLGREQIRNLTVDRRGRLLVVMNSLYVMEDGATDRFVRITIPGIENTRSVMEDLEGNYWVGSAGDGIARIRASGFRMVTPEDGIFGGNTRTVASDLQGNIWAGLPTTGVARLEPNGHTTVIATGEGTAGEVWSVLPALDGKVWIGTRTSLRVWHDGQLQEFPRYQKIRSLFQSRDGTVWIGSESDGVTRYRDGAFTPMADAIRAQQPGPPGKLPPTAMAFAEDAGGAVYAGLRESGGLVKIKDDTVTVFHPSQGFPTNEIRAIYPDREGNLWLGTKGRGLVVFTGGRWLNPEILSESFNDQVSVILEDDSGRLWLGTPKGIVRAPKTQLLALARGEPAKDSFRLTVESDGVRPAIVGTGSSPAAQKTADGMLWFGSRRGLVAVDPRKVLLNRVPPPVSIEGAVVDSQSAPPGSEIRLPAGTRALTINYTAPSFVGPSQVLFRYRLEGHDRPWTEAGTRRTAFYTTLEPGTYRFHVIACNDDGVWNETGASIAIVQLPFFYRTNWFYGLVALGLTGSGLGIFRWRTQALKKRNTELERAIAERTRELARSYDAIRASEYFYQSLVESLPQVIVRKDTACRFTYANAAFSELINRPLDQIIGQLEADLYPASQAEEFRASDQRALHSRQTLEYETLDERPGRPPRYLHVKKVPLFDQQGQALGVQILFWDMTTFRETEEKLKSAQHQLVETSRLAGIAEMATGILHNLGNALNSVNITTNLTVARLQRSKIEFVGRTAQLLTENSDRLPDFFSTDPRARKLPGYLSELAGHLATERDEILAELQGLQAGVDHIKELVASQQQHANAAGITEVVAAAELVEYALRIAEASLARNGITVVREFMPAPPVKVERHKALQIVGNLLANARDALGDGRKADRRIALGVRLSAEGRVQIHVTDNGPGILAENLARIFAFGFTTKKTGHGFGLHSSALAAKAMGGTLSGFSEGPGKGATFVFELPPSSD